MTRYLLPVLLLTVCTLLVGVPVTLSLGVCVLLLKGVLR